MSAPENNSNILRVRAYVLGRMSADERRAFEEQLRADASLQALVSVETQRINVHPEKPGDKNGWACVHGEESTEERSSADLRMSLDGSTQSLVNADTQRIKLPDDSLYISRVGAYVRGEMSAEERSAFEGRMRSDTRIQSLVNAETQRVKTQIKHPDSHLVWAYVHGEMGADDRRDFEARMSRDTTLQSLVNAETQRVHMKEEHPDSAGAWAYVHGQMAESERRDFEARMTRDGTLRALVGEVRECDRELRRLAPFAGLTEETLEKDLLAAWEASRADTGAPASPSTGPGAALPLNAKRSARRYLNSKPVRFAMALAACCLIAVVGVRQLQSPPIVWEVEIIQQATYRGAGGEEMLPRYTRADMTELTSSLRSSVEDEFRVLTNRDKKAWREWVLSTRIQELEAGRLAVQVQAYESKDGKPVKEWLKNYPDAQAFRSRVYDYGRQIVQDLAKLGHASQDHME